MRSMHTKIVTILIIGTVFTAGLAVSFGVPAFAGGGDPLKGLNISCAPKGCGKTIADNANITEADVEKVIDALMKVSPAFTIDEDGLPEKMNKADLVEAIASGANLTKADARRALDAFVGAIAKSLRGSNRVALVGFGSFSISKRKARTGRNPQQIAIPDDQAETGATIQIPAK